MDRCRFCGNLLEWCQRTDERLIAMHPVELPTRQIPPRMRWHMAAGIAHHGDAGSRWCHIPHPVICPAITPDRPLPAPAIDALRRYLSLRTRVLIDQGFQPAPALSAPSTPHPADRTDDSVRPVVHFLQTHYLAPGPLASIRCVAQTRRRQRCPNTITTDSEPGRWLLMPLDVQPDEPGHRRHLAEHLLPTEMAIYHLGHTPLLEQLRWRAQHCRAHAHTSAADLALTQWQVLDPFLHRQYLHTNLVPQPDQLTQ
jgi:hypothetical protein